MIKALVLVLALAGSAWGQDRYDSNMPVVLSSGTRTAGITTDGELKVAASINTAATYSATTIALAPASTPTDIMTLTGSATKTIRVKKIGFDASATNNTLINVVVLRRSTANSGGTSATPTVVTYDTTSSVATGVVRTYTANPTVGTLVGNIVARKMWVPATAPLATGQSNSDHILYEASAGRREIVLRGTSEVLAINLNSVTLTGGNVTAYIEFTEE